MQRLISLAIFAVYVCGFALGCTNLRRSTESGYANRDDQQNFGRDRRSLERENVAAEMAQNRRADSAPSDPEAINLRIRLGKAERSLEGKREREQYFKNKPYLRSDRERLEMLSLGSFESRARWLNSKGVLSSTTQHPAPVQALIDINDIAVGMTKAAVRDSWGEPELIEVSGNPIYGNERWHFSEQTSSTDGYRSQHRLVYFESGRVVGWESK